MYNRLVLRDSRRLQERKRSSFSPQEIEVLKAGHGLCMCMALPEITNWGSSSAIAARLLADGNMYFNPRSTTPPAFREKHTFLI